VLSVQTVGAMLAITVAVASSQPPIADLQKLVDAIADKYKSSVVLGMTSASLHLSLAGGVVDRRTKAKAQPQDEYLWGSITKTMTGAAILRLLSEGKIKSLDDPVHLYVDPVLSRANYPYLSLFSLFQTDVWAIPPPPGFQFNASEITIRHLLSMRSGIRDSDTAAFRHTQYTHPNVDFSPLDLLDISHGPLMFKPGGPVPSHGGHHPHMHMNFNYCSINFVLLGLVLAHFSGSKTWAEYDQSSILPRSTHGSVRFPQSGPCSQYTNVHGYDEASNYAPFDVSPISCLAGWTAGNVVMPVQAAANWTYSLYATEEVLPSKYVAMMVPGPHQEIYGLATFNFSGRYANGTEGRAWGHLGDTYGFTSIIAYFPNISMGLAVATNVEGSEQTAPREVLCVVYNRLLDWVRGRSEARTCRYIHVSFYLSGCQCSA
jgi:D-alanyl-D-alanine carboxypeptidase